MNIALNFFTLDVDQFSFRIFYPFANPNFLEEKVVEVAMKAYAVVLDAMASEDDEGPNVVRVGHSKDKLIKDIEVIAGAVFDALPECDKIEMFIDTGDDDDADGTAIGFNYVVTR